MDKETLSNYGWIVICVLVLAVMIALATPFGTFVSGAVQSTTQGLFDVNKSALDSTGLINIDNQSFTNEEICGLQFGKPYSIEADKGVYYSYVFHENGGADIFIYQNGIVTVLNNIPEGSFYYDEENIYNTSSNKIVATILENGKKIDTDGIVLTLDLIKICAHSNTEIVNVSDRYTGDTHCTECDSVIKKGEFIITAEDIRDGVYLVGVTSMKTGTYDGATAMYKSGETFPTPQNGDVYVKGDYEYRYNYRWNVNVNGWEENWRNIGWGVRVLDTSKTNYDKILSTVNGQPVGLLFDTYFECKNMVYAPELPETAVELCGTFGNCTSLKESPAIPEGVIFLGNVYQYCTSMTVLPSIPESVKDVQSYLFYGCNSLSGTLYVPCGAEIGYNISAYSIATESYHVTTCGGSCGK